MVSGLSEFKFLSNFTNSSLQPSKAENVLKQIPDMINKAVKWFEGKFNRADTTEKHKREVSLKQKMVSSVQPSQTFTSTKTM